jgi:hypothetical protein
MRVLRLLLCKLNWHQPYRRRAHWDGLNYIAPCLICEQQLRRRERGHWVRDWMEVQERRPDETRERG